MTMLTTVGETEDLAPTQDPFHARSLDGLAVTGCRQNGFEIQASKADPPDVAWGLGFEFGVVSARCRSKIRRHHGYNGTLACDSGLVDAEFRIAAKIAAFGNLRFEID